MTSIKAPVGGQGPASISLVQTFVMENKVATAAVLLEKLNSRTTPKLTFPPFRRGRQNF